THDSLGRHPPQRPQNLYLGGGEVDVQHLGRVQEPGSSSTPLASTRRGRAAASCPGARRKWTCYGEGFPARGDAAAAGGPGAEARRGNALPRACSAPGHTAFLAGPACQLPGPLCAPGGPCQRL
ncbi:unnamed protein product, partial [Effrenium voratum]